MPGTSPLERLRGRLPPTWDPRRLLKRRPTATTAVAVVAVAGLLRLLRLGHESLWLDEAGTVRWVTRQTTLELLLEVPLHHPNPPLYYLLLDGWVALAGTGEAALRFPSAVLGTAAVALAYVLGSELYDRRAGLAGAAILGVSSFHIHYSQEARNYVLLAFLTLASYMLLVRVLGDDGAPTLGRTAGGYVVATALLGYTHVYGFFVILAQNLYVLPRLLIHDWLPKDASRTGRRVTWRTWLGLQAAVGALVAPYLLALAIRARSLAVGEGAPLTWLPERGLRGFASIVQSYVVYPMWEAETGTGLSVVNAVAVAAILLVLATALLPVVSALRRRGHPLGADRWAPMLVLWFLTPLVGGYLVSITVTPLLWPRYTISASLALFLLAGAGISRLRKLSFPGPSDLPLGWHHVVAGVLVLALAVPLPGYYAHDQKEQWREAVAHVEASASPGALVVVSETYTEKAYRYYADRDDLAVAALDDEAPPARVDAAVAGHDEVWVVLSHVRTDAIVDHLASPDGGFALVDETAYLGIDVHELLRQS